MNYLDESTNTIYYEGKIRDYFKSKFGKNEKKNDEEDNKSESNPNIRHYKWHGQDIEYDPTTKTASFYYRGDKWDVTKERIPASEIDFSELRPLSDLH